MALELQYNLRYLLVRKTSTLMTLGGIALVVMVFVATLMLAEGLRATLAGTGGDRNIIVIRSGAQNELQSGIQRDDANAILVDAAVARLADGSAYATSDTVVVTSLKKRADGSPSNVTIRGTSPAAYTLRPGIEIVSGRLPVFGTNEVMVGKAIFDKYTATEVGKSLRILGNDLPVVGVFDAGNSGFSSEIWGDANILLPALKREQFSSITFRLSEGAEFEQLKRRLEEDPRMSVNVFKERDYYESQSRTLAMVITFLGVVISILFSLGAILGALITMYSAVSSRTREIGILRALGFGRLRIFGAFIAECLVLSLGGGLAGIIIASFLSLITISTTNFQTFADIAFGFRLTWLIAAWGILFALTMGIIGGALPAWKASKIKLLEALRET